MSRAAEDMGFADRNGAARAILRLKLRASLHDARARLAAALDLLDERADARGGDNTPPREQGIGLTGSDQQRAISRLAVCQIESDDMREQQLLEGADLLLQFLDTLSGGLRHGLFSIRQFDGGQAIRPESRAHCLSECAK